MKDEDLKTQVKNGLTRLSRGRKFYARSEAGELESELWELRCLIDEFGKQNLAQAIKSAHRFLKLHEKIFERVDDSDGAIAPIFHQLVEDLAKMYGKQASSDSVMLSKQVFEMIENNGYSAYDYVISDFSSVLGESGLKHLEEKVRKTLGALPKNEKDDFDFTRDTYIHALYDIADARSDVDNYIAVVDEFGQYPEPEKLKIGQRLVKAERYKEALSYFQKIEASSRWREDASVFEITALEKLGGKECAQNLRIEYFLRTLKSKEYEECLKYASDPDKTKKDLLLRVLDHSCEHRALSFLVEIKELRHAAKLVRVKQEKWSGRLYTCLYPVARDLEHQHPLESTILYRVLIEDIMERVISRHYHHAVRYLKKIEGLSTRIEVWEDLPSHQNYFDNFSKVQSKKPSFWRKYNESR